MHDVLNDKWDKVYLTQNIYKMVLKSQLAHKIVNLLFDDWFDNFKLTNFWGS